MSDELLLFLMVWVRCFRDAWCVQVFVCISRLAKGGDLEQTLC